MNLVRKIKISNITNIPLTGIEKVIDDYFNSLLCNLTPYLLFTNPNEEGSEITTYFTSENKYVFEIERYAPNYARNTIYLNSIYSSILEKQYNIPSDDVIDYLKFKIKSIYKLDFEALCYAGESYVGG